MKTAIKTIMIGVAACAFAAPAFAYTINGTIPGNTRNMTAIHLQKPPSPNGYLKLTLSAPDTNVGVGYSVAFCISPASSPASHPCPSNGPGLLVVPGQPTIVFVYANIYPSYVVWVGTGLRAAVPYILDVDYIP
jgi:hypothetical protein